MTEAEYIAVSDLQRMRAASRMLADVFERDDLREVTSRLENIILVAGKHVNKMCD